MNKTIIFLFVFALISCNNNSTYKQYAITTIDTLQEWYDEETGLYKTTSWWNAANIITALIDYSQITGSDKYLKVIDNTFEICKEFEVQMPNPDENWICTNYINDYYDDEGWWILAWIKAYDLTNDNKYLKMAKITFSDMALGWDSVCGGGVYWKKPNIGKSAVQNELFMLSALRLHQRDGGEVLGKTYLAWAEDTFQWFINSGMVTENYLVENGLNKNCEVSRGSFYTYNQGIILSALVEYYKIINENFLIELAHEIANSTISNLVYEDGVLRDLKEPDLNGDASQFKGIFMRNLAYLHSFDPKENYKDFILLNADSIWNLARNKETNEIGVVWNSFSDRADASCQSSALDAFNAALIVTN